MNNSYKALKFFTLILLIISCNSTKRNIILHQKTTKKPIIIRASLEDSTIYEIKLPNRLKITNKALFAKSFIMINYLYQDSLSKWADRNIQLFRINDETLITISNNKRKTIAGRESLEFIYYTRHFLNPSKSTQQQFKPYLKKMLTTNKDTLHIGTVTEFRQKHPKLFQQLTKNDRISIQFLEGKKLGKPISLPVTW
ncbi:conserved hypothetical protein [Tenacibaculum maritimum]|nr:conserved hypothetical protein [Tenacibaculum maritimum]